ncbi:glutathione S-transferase [Maricaulis sp.]|uniref:glutathione S-transferase n=1 Tax=Maricaulis sp. TaxID=1486257 RepID=UPI00260673FA|nr:glutathione S-transferase [Maricaulis sp.]
MTASRPILYSFRRCPYAMRARLALHVSGIEVEHREILLKDKPQAMLDVSPKGTVPVLVLPDGQVLEESLDVMRWALSQNDPEAWLPLDNQMRDWVASNDGPFKQALDRYKYASRFDDADAETEREIAATFLRQLDAALRQQPWLSGQAPGFADHAIFPFTRQYAMTDRDWFNAQDWPALISWLDTLLASDRFADIMQKHEIWSPQAK